MASAGSPVTRETNLDPTTGSNRRHAESRATIHPFERTAHRAVEHLLSVEPERVDTLFSPTMHVSPGAQLLSDKRPARFAVKTKQRIVLLDATDISAVEARGNYIVLRYKSSPIVVRESLSNIAEKLKPYGLFRIHRSYLVNMAFVVEMKALSTGEYLLRLREGKGYIVSRTYKKNLRFLADLWIGVRGPAE
jgi:DNA-binding LytR/AlgR family response regulator